MRIEPLLPNAIVRSVREQQEIAALMMQAMGTNLPRPVREVPYPEAREPRVRAIPAIEAYTEQVRGRQPNYIDEYC